MKPSVIIAPDSFKGSCTSVQVAEALAEGGRSVCSDAHIISLPLADGGEGTLSIVLNTLGGTRVTMQAHDALMRLRSCSYGILPDEQTAVFEVAETCGLTLLQPAERNPVLTTSFGVGEQLVHAYNRGCRRFFVGLGGSAVCDAGKGMLQAIPPAMLPLFRSVEIVALCDVDNPLYGINGAAYVFAPQKGATPAQVQQLDTRLRAVAARYGDAMATQPRAGAAGGLGYALSAVLNARLQSGAQTLLDLLQFDQYLSSASLVITGEGCIDRQTLSGKLPMAVLERACKAHVPVVALAGQVKDKERLLASGFTDVICINPDNVDDMLAIDTDYALSRLRLVAAQLVQGPLLIGK